MNKYILFLLSLIFVYNSALLTSAQETPTLTATLDINTPAAKSIPEKAQYADVARITLAASGYDILLDGIILSTDVSGGLNNFTNIYIYDAKDNSLLGYYPKPTNIYGLVEFKYIRIANGSSKTFLVRANLSDTAAGNVRVGFSGFTYATDEEPTLSGIPIYGNIMTLPGTVLTPIPTPTPTPTPIFTSTPTPSPTGGSTATPASLGFISLAALNLSEGNTISASGSSDPDIYIVNEWGYKRLFLNPVIFGFYGHLGGFANVRNVVSSTRDRMVTSGLFRNCETNDTKVYGVEVTGEDVGILHWVNTTGEQAVSDDSEFFKKVFCINSAEFNWYSQGSEYTSVNQVPTYSR